MENLKIKHIAFFNTFGELTKSDSRLKSREDIEKEILSPYTSNTRDDANFSSNTAINNFLLEKNNDVIKLYSNLGGEQTNFKVCLTNDNDTIKIEKKLKTGGYAPNSLAASKFKFPKTTSAIILRKAKDNEIETEDNVEDKEISGIVDASNPQTYRQKLVECFIKELKSESDVNDIKIELALLCNELSAAGKANEEYELQVTDKLSNYCYNLQNCLKKTEELEKLEAELKQKNNEFKNIYEKKQLKVEDKEKLDKLAQDLNATIAKIENNRQEFSSYANKFPFEKERENYNKIYTEIKGFLKDNAGTKTVNFNLVNGLANGLFKKGKEEYEKITVPMPKEEGLTKFELVYKYTVLAAIAYDENGAKYINSNTENKNLDSIREIIAERDGKDGPWIQRSDMKDEDITNAIKTWKPDFTEKQIFTTLTHYSEAKKKTILHLISRNEFGPAYGFIQIDNEIYTVGAFPVMEGDKIKAKTFIFKQDGSLVSDQEDIKNLPFEVEYNLSHCETASVYNIKNKQVENVKFDSNVAFETYDGKIQGFDDDIKNYFKDNFEGVRNLGEFEDKRNNAEAFLIERPLVDALYEKIDEGQEYEISVDDKKIEGTYTGDLIRRRREAIGQKQGITIADGR